jgi:hypothetical protein
MSKMQKTSIRLCKTCIYSRTTSATANMNCEYFLITGNRRGCKVGECDKYKKSNTKRIPKALKEV